MGFLGITVYLVWYNAIFRLFGEEMSRKRIVTKETYKCKVTKFTPDGASFEWKLDKFPEYNDNDHFIHFKCKGKLVYLSTDNVIIREL